MSVSSSSTESKVNLDSLHSAVSALGAEVRSLKSAGAAKSVYEAAVVKLNEAKAALLAATGGGSGGLSEKDQLKTLRSGLEDLLIRRFFYVPAFEIYQGVSGLYDFGPPGCALKQNLIQQWRQHFVMHEQMLEVDCAALTPHVVLKTSGHVDKFTDFMVRDEKTLEPHRADKILEDHMDTLLEDKKNPPSKAQRDEYLLVKTQAGAYGKDDLHSALRKYNVRAPGTGNGITEPFAFNLMFETQIGPTGQSTGYLRPETAQGIFVNFKRLLGYNSDRMPFAAAQIGLAFRNEIAPRAGLLRVREFPLAEIEHFVDPLNKKHPRFNEVSHIVLQLLHRSDQTGEDKARPITVGDAVRDGLINNETLGYFMARTQLFLISVGIKPDRLRFRQHKSTEMAHYAADCYDAEIYGSYGWIECVGHADRSAFDLTAHSDKSKIELVAQEKYPEPILEDFPNVKLQAGVIGKKFGKTAKALMDHLKTLPFEPAIKLALELKEKPTVHIKLCTGEEYDIDSSMVEITAEKRKVSVRKYIPSVIEPSFGLGRILYHILEHSYFVRPEPAVNPSAAATAASSSSSASKEKGETKAVRAVLSLPPQMCPVKVGLLPISSQQILDAFVNDLSRSFTSAGISNRSDSSAGSIGRRYAKLDEIGTAFDVTVDFETPKAQTVTLRERDSTQQVRMKMSEVVEAVKMLVAGQKNWAEIYASYPQVIREENDE